MFVPPWLHQLQRSWFSRQSSKSRNVSRRSSVQRRVRLTLELLEDRLAPSADSVQTVASNLSTPFSESQQTVSLSANVSDTTNPSTTVSEGTVTFTVKDSSGNTIGSSVQGPVSNGKASANFNLPSNEAAGKYTIAVSYSDSAGTFTDGGDTSGTLTVNPAIVKVVAGNSSATFSKSSQTVTLTANLTDDSFPSETVKDGTVTFTVKDKNGFVVGSSVQGTVSGGKAAANFTLPAGSARGTYTVAVAYSDSSGSGNFSDDGTDTSGQLNVSPAGTTTQASNATANFSTSSQNVTLTATVTSGSGVVNEGKVSFTLIDSNGNTIGSTTSSAVTNGSASVSYALPGSTAVGSYSIEALYTDSAGNFADSFDSNHTLTVNPANSTNLSLTSASIVPDLVNGTAQVTLTAQATSSAGTVNQGVLSFAIGSVSAQANVSNGTASVQLTVPIQNIFSGFNVNMSFTNNANPASFANGNASQFVNTNTLNALLPANLTFDSSHNETMNFSVGGVPLFDASYSSSNGLLSEVSLGSLSVPVTYTQTGSSMVASVEGVPWGVVLFNGNGQFQGFASVAISSDGSAVWVVTNSNNQPVGEFPYGGDDLNPLAGAEALGFLPSS